MITTPGLVRATAASGAAAERLPAESFSERQTRQRQQFMGEAASSQSRCCGSAAALQR